MPAAYLASVDYPALCIRLERLFERDLAMQPPIVMRQLRAMAKYDALSRLARLSAIPTLVVAAQFDRIALPEFGRQLAAAIPGARYVELPDAGHAAPIQCAESINQLLAKHLEAGEPTAEQSSQAWI